MKPDETPSSAEGIVLVAEDLAEAAERICTAVQAEGLPVECVFDGPSVLRELGGRPGAHAVLIMDWVLAGSAVQGAHLLDEIARLAEPPAVIIFSEEAGVEEVTAARRQHAFVRGAVNKYEPDAHRHLAAAVLEAAGGRTNTPTAANREAATAWVLGAAGAEAELAVQALAGGFEVLTPKEEPRALAELLAEAVPALLVTIGRAELAGDAQGVLEDAVDRGACHVYVRRREDAYAPVGARLFAALEVRKRDFPERLRQCAQRAVLVSPAREAVARPHPVVGESAAIAEARRRARQLGPTDFTVHIKGATGVGKEGLARMLHEASGREGPFVDLNCSTLRGDVQVAELFGHARGAFTGADADRDGLFVQADGGTLFLDEVGDLPAEAQSMLLRVLEDRQVRPVGGKGSVAVNVRVLSAAHDLEALVRAGTFRSDLYYRLAVGMIEVPPLEERRADIPRLACHLLHRHALASRMGRTPVLTEGALRWLEGQSWPGNVRQLGGTLIRALASGEPVVDETLVAACHGAESASAGVVADEVHPVAPERPADAEALLRGALEASQDDELAADYERLRDTLERLALEVALARTNGSVGAAGKLLGLGRTRAYDLRKKHRPDLEDPR